ncbi:hypothetical protein AAG570_005071 [Ranatra chinensis]|uniref:Uncharacterized protein n=1 Tax=Ranatra chinensis TaxID=642074 RepID=A0ABD0YHQ3_9HEMI
MASKRRNIFHKNKKQETTEIVWGRGCQPRCPSLARRKDLNIPGPKTLHRISRLYESPVCSKRWSASSRGQVVRELESSIVEADRREAVWTNCSRGYSEAEGPGSCKAFAHLTLFTESLNYRQKTNLQCNSQTDLDVRRGTVGSNLDRVQSFQSKVLRTVLDAPWYVSNRTTHHDFNIPTVQQSALNRLQKFLDKHSNPLANALSSLSHPLEPPRRLKRRWPRDRHVE